MIIIGSHVSFKKPLMYLGALRQALSFGANTFMIYSGPPQNTKRLEIDSGNIQKTLEEMKIKQLSWNHLIGHAPYIINLSNPFIIKRTFAIDFLAQELNRFEQMKIPQMVLHPGNNLNRNKKEAIEWIASGINTIFKKTSNLKIKIALETMAGKGNEIGCCFQELRDIIDLIDDKKRISVCFDTCHVFDSGYDIKDHFELVMQDFDSIINLKYLSVFHINDSKNDLGSKKDRHANIGYGSIGFMPLMKIIYHPSFLHIPKILETPFINEEPPYKQEIDMIKQKKFNMIF
ncbi:deoxyribonuclease IV [Candidatus Phytoplasma melaleucae]|uniref:Probable endonuclease 4 n=1 Tax=Candidatus Phytoplasma melaleucae TaxID=2982630 RepID=A0ABT9DDP6_9MOLU|nr:deoxyribonuclease IV ['Melaleuca sp.' phytoplasma]MDO8168162.1 deoxyribonuclease IV ['Melaleuca sp.' phytoplasma]MDV3205472.1 deoxyribonuclease IV [Weeping tea tree witches'-broom phytoplasma]